MRISFMVLLVSVALLGCHKEESPAPGRAESAAGASTPAAGSDLDIKGRRIDINVKAAGYDPSEVQVTPHEEVTLVFTRTEKSECAKEIVIPSENVKRTLPLNEPVAVSLKAGADGEIGFACGMNMMKGKLVVQN